MNKISSLCIILAGIFWGCMGIFVRKLCNDYGFTSLQTSFLRLSSAAILFVIFTLITDRKRLKIHLCDAPLLLLLGVVSVFLMTVSYFTSMTLSSLSVAAIILYTAPILVMIMSVIFFKEKVTAKKITALIMAFSGCVFVSGIATGEAHVTLAGAIAGVVSAVAYASYSIIGTFALKKHHPYTVTTWAFVFAALAAITVSNPPDLLSKITAVENTPILILWILGTGLFTAFLPFLLYTVGLKGTEPSKAAVMASVEPMVATIAGIAVFHERPDIFSVLGILLILFAILVLNNFGMPEKKNK